MFRGTLLDAPFFFTIFYNFLHLHPVRRLLLRCSTLRQIHPLPLCKVGYALAAWLNNPLSHWKCASGSTRATRTSTVAMEISQTKRQGAILLRDDGSKHERKNWLGTTGSKFTKRCLARHVLSRTGCKQLPCRWKDINKDDVCRVKSSRTGPTATLQEHHQGHSYDT